MPQRFLRPGIVTSKRFNRLPWPCQSLVYRLINLVDDYGRYDAEPELVRAYAFPYGDPSGKQIPLTNVSNWLQLSANADILVLYEVEEKKYLQLARWQERPRSQSRYPEQPANNCKHLLAIANKCLPSSPSPSPQSSPSPSPSPSPPDALSKGSEELLQHSDAKRVLGKLSEDVFGEVLRDTQWPNDMEHWLNDALPIKASDLNLVDWLYRLPLDHPIFTVTLRKQSMRALVQGGLRFEAQKIRSALAILAVKKNSAPDEPEPEEDEPEWTNERMVATRELFPGINESVFNKAYVMVAGDVRAQIETYVGKMKGQNNGG
jgi:hypothetical protein